jgi:hypothetical protein
MIEDLYQDWKAHGIEAIRECRERRPSDYLWIVAMIVSNAEDLSAALGRTDRRRPTRWRHRAA